MPQATMPAERSQVDASKAVPALVTRKETSGWNETLQQLAKDMEAVAERLVAVASEPRSFSDPKELSKRAKAILEDRRAIGSYFDPKLFGDPCYDMMLDLYVAAAEGRKIGVSSCCIASGVAPTTALRWIKKLQEEGLIEIAGDPVDKRRRFVRLSTEGGARMRLFLSR